MEIGIWENVTKTEKRAKDKHILYYARCKFCGKERIAPLSNLKQAKICKHIQTGIKNERIRSIYSSMKRRCYNSNSEDYRFYGEKGIKICDEWIDNPKKFEEWALSNGYESKLTIDRINSDMGYSPENCRWITVEDNSRYKSTTMIIDIDGKKKTGKEWAKEIGAGINSVNRLRRLYGEEKTIKFIKYCMENGLPKVTKSNGYMKVLEQIINKNV